MSILFSILNICTATVNIEINTAPENGTFNECNSKLIHQANSMNIYDVSKIPPLEPERSQYIYDELTRATRKKTLPIIDFLLNLNFETSCYLLFNQSLACIAGISAAHGHPEDIEILEKILNAKESAFELFRDFMNVTPS